MGCQQSTPAVRQNDKHFGGTAATKVVPSSQNGDNNNNNNMNNKSNHCNKKDLCCTPNQPKQSFRYHKNACALEYWEPIRLLGEGSISSIHLVRRRPHRVDIPYQERRDIMRAVDTNNSSNSSRKLEETEEVYALKSIMKDHVSNDQYLEEMRTEIYTMSRLCHDNIAQVIEAFERKRHIYLVMEYCRGGNLCERKLAEPEVAVVIRKVLSAVDYMHNHNVVHRDIKLENIMFSKDPSLPDAEIKIIDFGLATKFLSNEYKRMTARVGTLYSMAPQVLQGVYDAKCDIWSIGVVTYMLLSGLQPFWGPPQEMSWEKRQKIMIDRIMRCEYMKMRGPSWHFISPEAKSFVASLLQMVPSRRPTAEKALKMPWIVKYENHKPSAMPAQNDQYAKKIQLKRAAQVLMAQELDEDTIVQLKGALQKHDPHQKDQITIQHFYDALLQHSTLTTAQVDSLFSDKSLDRNQYINYVDMFNDTINRKMRKQKELIVNIFNHCGADSCCKISKDRLKTMLAESSVAGDEVLAKTIDKIINDLASNDSDETPMISCQQLIDRLRTLEMERVDIISTCPDPGSKNLNGTSSKSPDHDINIDNAIDSSKQQQHDDDGRIDDLVDENNAVIPGGRRPDPNSAEPLFIYDDVSKSMRKFKRGEVWSESVISV